jgi:hypothetical protein
MDEGYLEALNACKTIVQNQFDRWLDFEERKPPRLTIQMVDVFNSIKKEMDEL